MMEHTYWHKQAPDKPLFPDLIWSRPENRAFAGKLLVIGGNVHGFAAAAEAYAAASKAGIGSARVLLPDSLQKTIGRAFEAGEFAPSTPSGSFSQKALAGFLDAATWADGVLLAGDLARNSETAIVLERFAAHYSGQLSLTKDAADYFLATPQLLLARPQTLLVISLAGLQKLAQNARFTTAFRFDMDLLRLVDALHEFSSIYPMSLIVKHLGIIFVACGGQVSSTKLTPDRAIWRVTTAARASTWWLQNPSKTFEALTTAIHETAIC